MPRAYLIYNPVAGRYSSRMLVERAVKVFAREGWDVSVNQSLSGRQITQAARDAAEEGVEVFIVVGGDGSMNCAAAGLINSNTALGVLPAGTSNVWAQELHMDAPGWTHWDALGECSQQLINGNIHTVDVGICNGLPFLLWVGFGLDGYIVNHIEPRPRWKKILSILHYGTSAVWYARNWKGSEFHILVDGSEIAGHYLMVLVSNISLYAGGIIQLPTECFLDDGVMDLWLVEGDRMADTVHSAWDLLSQRSQHSQNIHRISFSKLNLVSEMPVYGQIDGEPIKQVGRMDVHVQPRALRVLVPQKVSENLFQAEPII